MAAVTIRSDFRAQEGEICHCVHIYPFYSPWSNEAGCHDLGFFFFFLIFSFDLALSLSSFTLIKRLFSSSSLSFLRVLSSASLRLFMSLPTILIPACHSSNPVFLMMCSLYKLKGVTADRPVIFHMCVYAHVCVYICVYTHYMHVYIYTHTHMCTYIYNTHLYIYIHACICVYTYIHIHYVYIHTYLFSH